jgi:hypothetical protein
MKRALASFVALLLVTFAIGCGTVGKNFDSSRVKNIQNNQTNQSQILDWFGVPFKEGNENGHTMWTYQFDKWKAIGDNESKDLVILFDDSNIVKAYRYTDTLAE